MKTVINKCKELSLNDSTDISDDYSEEECIKKNDKELIYKDFVISIKNIDIPKGNKHYIICMYIYENVGRYAIKFEKYKSSMNLKDLTHLIFKNFIYVIPGVSEIDRTDTKKHIYHDIINEYYEIYTLQDRIYIYIGTSDKYETYDDTSDGFDKFLNRNEGVKKNNFCNFL